MLSKPILYLLITIASYSFISCDAPCYIVTCEDDATKKSFKACKVCPPNICPINQSLCGEDCVDFQSDINHCGGCGKQCPKGTRCIDGRCKLSCPKATPTPCSDGCYDLKTDAKHCGQCGHQCPDGKRCVDGKCI